MRAFKLSYDQDHTQMTSIVFSGGEIHVDLSYLPTKVSEYTLKAHLQSSEDIMHFFMVCDALGRKWPDAKSTVFIPYMPYARQDRMCSDGQHFGLEVFAKMLNGIPQRNLITYDLHSEVLLDLLDESFIVNNVTQRTIIGRSVLDDLLNDTDMWIVSPDKGAKKKAINVASKYCQRPIFGDKVRDPQTGDLTGFTSNFEDYNGRDLLIVDDIMDNGGTFLGLAEELRGKGAGKISLYVTHLIAEKGVKHFEGIIDTIYTTDSFRRGGLKLQVDGDVKIVTIKL